jgi:hypothetical protein
MARPKGSSRHIQIQDWDVDEANIEEMAAHGLTVEVLDDVLGNQPRFRRNKKGRSATYQMVGPDSGGRMWVACILETGPGIWRPITGWVAAGHEIQWWRRSK